MVVSYSRVFRAAELIAFTGTTLKNETWIEIKRLLTTSISLCVCVRLAHYLLWFPCNPFPFLNLLGNLPTAMKTFA